LEIDMQACKNIGIKKGRSSMLLKYSWILITLIPSLCWAAGESTVPEGTRITLQLNDPLSTKRNNEGDVFKAIVVKSVALGDRIVIPKGSVVTGSISRIKRPGVIKGKSLMNLLFQSINIPGHGDHAILAKLAELPENKSGVYPEGTVVGEGSAKQDLGKLLAPPILGAGIGGLANGGKGAAIGGGIGAAVGIGTIFSTREKKDIELSRGATLIISLERPLIIAAENDFDAAKR
jgi:hypothetical protein